MPKQFTTIAAAEAARLAWLKAHAGDKAHTVRHWTRGDQFAFFVEVWSGHQRWWLSEADVAAVKGEGACRS